MRQVLKRLEELVSQLEPGQREKYLPQIKEIRHRLDYPDMKLAVIGNFSCGKSTFLNAVLKTPLLTMDNMPTTAVPTCIDWNGESGKTTVTVADIKGNHHVLDRNGREWFRHAAGRELPADMGELLDYLTTTNTLTHVLSKISISFPGENGHKGFCIVDTPGVNPGDEEAADHILKTQALLREEADAAIVLFPSYCVYTRDFQNFLDQNAKHLLAHSIFVVTKMDMVTSEKERESLVHFVKKQLEKNFELDDPKVYGCSAGRALDFYTSHSAERDTWTDSFEQMLDGIFRSLQGRRNRIVTENTKKMLGNLMEELRAEIDSQQNMLLETRQCFTEYSYENLVKEYKNGFEPYRCIIQGIADKKRNEMERSIQSKSGRVANELIAEANSAKQMKQLNVLMGTTCHCKINELNEVLGMESVVSMKSLNREMNRRYVEFMTQMQDLLEKYQYSVGKFEMFAHLKEESEKKGNAIAERRYVVSPSSVFNQFDLQFVQEHPFVAVTVGVVGGIAAIFAPTMVYTFAIEVKRKQAIDQIKENMVKYAAGAAEQCVGTIRLLEDGYIREGEKLLAEYTKEYKAFFEEKERRMKTYKADVEDQIRENEERIATMDEMSRAILCEASRQS